MLLINWGYIWRCPIVLLVILVSLSGLVLLLIVFKRPHIAGLSNTAIFFLLLQPSISVPDEPTSVLDDQRLQCYSATQEADIR